MDVLRAFNLANTPRVFHFETIWKRLFPRRFNVEYTWYVFREFGSLVNEVNTFSQERENVSELLPFQFKTQMYEMLVNVYAQRTRKEIHSN